MRVALALLTYAGLLATLGSYALRRASSLDRAPLLAIVVWLSSSASVLVSVVLAGVALTVPTARVSGSLAELLQACGVVLRARYAAPGGPRLGSALGVAGAALALAVLARAGSCLVAALARARGERVRQRQTLALVGRIDHGVEPLSDPTIDTVIVEHETATAYCLPGRRWRIVLSTAALAALSGEQLQAVLAHERAHLRGRHDLLIAAAVALSRAFPRVPVFQAAREEIVRLVEMRADEVASRTAGRLALAEALLALGGGAAPPTGAAAARAASPATALAVGGSTTAQRVHRLLVPPRPPRRAQTATCLLASTALLAVPVLLLAGPAAAVPTSHCPLDRPCSVMAAQEAGSPAVARPRGGAPPSRSAPSERGGSPAPVPAAADPSTCGAGPCERQPM